MNDEELAAAGLESDYGYHIEAPEPVCEVLVRDDPVTARSYPCLDALNTYSGCWGEACPLRTCWSGAPTPRYLALLRARLHLRQEEDAYEAGARCPDCLFAQPTTIKVAGEDRLPVELPLVACGKGCWTHPTTAAALARRRIPVAPHANPVHCRHFVEAAVLHPAVVAYRRRERERRRRARESEVEEQQELSNQSWHLADRLD